MKKNKFKTISHLARFSKIKLDKTERDLDRLLKKSKRLIESLIAKNSCYSWKNLMGILEETDDKIHRLWHPIAHLSMTASSEEIRQVYKKCDPKITSFYTALGQNEKLYLAIKQIADGAEYKRLNRAQKKIIDLNLLNFRLSGIGLEKEKKERIGAINKKLSELSNRFEENVMDATDGWYYLVTDEKKLAGVPKAAKNLAKHAAQKRKKKGWLFTTQASDYLPIIEYADDRKLRKIMYEARVTRASDQGLNAGKWNNSSIMEEILSLRHEKALILGYKNYAELSLANKMAESPKQVLGFLQNLADHSISRARKDIKALKHFARTRYSVDRLEPWDLYYFMEKMRKAEHDFSQEEIRPYFPEDKVLNGLFSIIDRLYHISFCESKKADLWHRDARMFDVVNKNGDIIGHLGLDLHSRKKKRGGAWMDSAESRRITPRGLQIPTAYVICNFTPPSGKVPSLLTHMDVSTLFHEFGHALHLLLTKVEYPEVGGTNVEWDAVELPSQIMENWCWERESLDVISGHFETGEKIPDKIYERMVASKNFDAAIMMARQLELALFDFNLHNNYKSEKGGKILETLKAVNAKVGTLSLYPLNRFPHSFTHIFAGGYAAGYYSYKWAEMLAADAFTIFKERGVFDRKTANSFRKNILEVGRSRDAMENFIAFRGRRPEVDALLKQYGLL